MSSQKFQPCTTTPFASRRTTMAEASDRGGFSRGFGRGGDRGDRRGRGGDRGGRGRGGRGRGRGFGKEDKDVWTPCTKLGRLVQAVRVRSIRCFCNREGMCARGKDASLSKKCFARSRRRVRRALEVATPSSRAISVPFFFRIDFGHGRAFWGSTSLSTCRSAHIHANVMCSSMSLLFVMEFIQGKIKSLEQIYLHSIPIKEYQIVDYFIGANLVDEVMKIMPVQKQTSAGQRMRFKAFVVVGDSNGHIGLGVKACKEVAHSIQGSMILAKLNMVPVRRGYWGAALGQPHTVPTKVHGKCGSVHIRLIPAPKGTGVVAAQTPKKVLVMAGIHDVFTCSRGHTRTLGNFVKATYFALRSTYEFLTPDLWAENKWQKAPEQEYTDFLSAPPKKVRQYEEY